MCATSNVQTTDNSEKYLYLLRDKDQPHFKIGIAKDVAGRAQSLLAAVDPENSYYVSCGKVPAHRIERMLHVLFGDYRIEKDSADGYTEWFALECFQEVKQFLELNHSKLHCSSLQTWPESPVAGLRSTDKILKTVSARPRKRDLRSVDPPTDGRADATRVATILRELFNNCPCLGRGHFWLPDSWSDRRLEEREAFIFQNASAVKDELKKHLSDFSITVRQYTERSVRGWNLGLQYSYVVRSDSDFIFVTFRRYKEEDLGLFPFLNEINLVLDSIPRLNNSIRALLQKHIDGPRSRKRGPRLVSREEK